MTTKLENELLKEKIRYYKAKADYFILLNSQVTLKCEQPAVSYNEYISRLYRSR